MLQLCTNTPPVLRVFLFHYNTKTWLEGIPGPHLLVRRYHLSKWSLPASSKFHWLCIDQRQAFCDRGYSTYFAVCSIETTALSYSRRRSGVLVHCSWFLHHLTVETMHIYTMIAFWYMACVLVFAFFTQFTTTGMSQYELRQSPNCHDTSVWDCFEMHPASSPTPINCSQLKDHQSIVCVRVGDIRFAGDGFGKALGVSASVVSFYVFLLSVGFSLLAQMCHTDKWRKRLGTAILLVVVVSLVFLYVGLLVVDSFLIFASYTPQRMQVVYVAILAAAVATILLLSDNTPLQQTDQQSMEEEANSRQKTVAICVVGFLLYFVPILLDGIDRRFSTDK